MSPTRFLQFAAAFFGLLAKDPKRAPTPTKLNLLMGRKPINSVDGEMTRWRNFLLRECGFKRHGPYGRWKR